jgi:hypothetical protein
MAGKAASPKTWILRTKQVTVTTWKFRLVVLLAAISLVFLTYPTWLIAIGGSLVHKENALNQADLIVVENFDTDYATFETAERLVQSGYGSRVLVPVRAIDETPQIGAVQKGFVEVMSRVAGIGQYEALPVRHSEPISLNVARQVADFLDKEHIRSVLVVSPALRSARSYLVYREVLTPRHVAVQCFATTIPAATDEWWHSWHCLQDVGIEFGKLLYYRFWVLERNKQLVGS